MRRRPILLAVATGAATLAGCLSDESNDDRTEGGTDDDGLDDGLDDGVSSGSGTGDTILDRFDGEPERPECEITAETVDVPSGDAHTEYETAETIPYPDPPASVSDEQTVVEYVEDFEHAFVRHDVLCDRSESNYVLNVGYDVEESRLFDGDDDVVTVFLYRAGGATWGIDDGNEWMTDLAYSGVVYAVDETGVARVDDDEANPWADDDVESNAPDPLETGELVASFE